MNTCFSCNYVQDPPYLVAEGARWKLYLDVNQAYLGESYLALREHTKSLSELSAEDWKEFEELVRKIEQAYTKELGVTVFNWSCFMNNAFIEEAGEPHVHWHITPRYQRKVSFAGETFTDEKFGYHKDIESKRTLEAKTMEQLTEQLKKSM